MCVEQHTGGDDANMKVLVRAARRFVLQLLLFVDARLVPVQSDFGILHERSQSCGGTARPTVRAMRIPWGVKGFEGWFGASD